MTGRGIAVVLMVLLFGCTSKKSRRSKLFPVRSGKRYGYINRNGQAVVPFVFSRAGCFAGGLALVRTSDSIPEWGYIDNSGRFAIQPKFSGAASYSEGLALVVLPGAAPQAIDKNGIRLFSLDSAFSVESFCDGYAAYSVLKDGAELWGFVDKAGRTVIEPQFVAVSFFSDGLCGVMNAHGQWGYINKDGEVVVEFLYDNAFPFSKGRAKVFLNGNWGIIDSKGGKLFKSKYEDIDIDGDVYLIKRNSLWGWVDKNGAELIALQFQDAYPFKGNKLAAAEASDMWGYINKQGKFNIAPQFDFAFGFDDGLAPVELEGKYGFVDETGGYVVKPVYDHLPVDYYVRYFTSASVFFNVRSGIERPDFVAYRWLSDFYHMNYEDAMLHSTPDTKALLREFSSVSDMIADSSRRSMAGIMVTLKGVEVSDNRAIVDYTLSDNKHVVQKLFLVRDRSRWLVQFDFPRGN